VTGLVAGGVGMVLNGVLAFLLLIPGVQRVREAAASAQSENNLKRIGLALHSYASAHDGLQPPAVVLDRNRKPLYSWRVLLLPFLEEDNLFHQFHLEEPWDSPHNRQFVERMPTVYRLPGAATTEPGLTFYQVFTGPETPFSNVPGGPYRDLGLDLQCQWRYRLGAIPDGTSNVFAVAEAADPVPWTKPADLDYHGNKPFPRVGRATSDSFTVLFFDGSTRRIRKSADERALRLYVTANNGQLRPELP
jgi:hypothetical protein